VVQCSDLTLSIGLAIYQFLSIVICLTRKTSGSKFASSLHANSRRSLKICHDHLLPYYLNRSGQIEVAGSKPTQD
jgi:hypothetical protein